MTIHYHQNSRLFRLVTGEMEYAFAVDPQGRLVHLHWGAPLLSDEDYMLLLSDGSMTTARPHGYDPGEYRFGAPFDYASPAIRVRFPDGVESLRLVYRSHEIFPDRLVVTLSDAFYPLSVKLVYQAFGDLPFFARYAVIENQGDGDVLLRTAMSATLQLPRAKSYRMTHFAGDWSAEYQRQETFLTQAKLVLDTTYLTDAAFHVVPFFALDDGHATETDGEVFFGALGYSGDFQLIAETSHMQTEKRTSVTLGIHDATSALRLQKGESFTTPPAYVGFSNRGFAHMSDILYDWQFDHILPRSTGGEQSHCDSSHDDMSHTDKPKDDQSYSAKFYGDKAHAPRPVIYNTWYPYMFDIDEQKLIDFIPKAKYIGAELYVIDDGWMKGRSNDKKGLGDWVIDPERFPHGLSYIADRVHEAGMLFGLWVEPEMVNPDSDLYRAHPDWVLSDPNRVTTEQRNQLILDMSRDDITDWTIDWLDELITTAKLDYLKWDMNREVTESGIDSYERGVAVRYMRNIERIWRHLGEKFPHLLLENCASGGGRADYGMLPYADRVNRSDNADPIDVMLLHEGYTTLFVPKLAGGAGNVSPSPNHVNKRTVPLSYRVNSGMTGSMSIGVNLLKSDAAELDALREAVASFKELRPALQDAYVYRIASARENPYSILQYVKRDRSQFTVFAFAHGMHHWEKQTPRFRMQGLLRDAIYENEAGIRLSGAALMHSGIDLPMYGDYYSQRMTWKRVR